MKVRLGLIFDQQLDLIPGRQVGKRYIAPALQLLAMWLNAAAVAPL